MHKQERCQWSFCHMSKSDSFTKRFSSSKFMLCSNEKKLKAIVIQKILLKNKSKNTKEK